jgi:hypothetical protein
MPTGGVEQLLWQSESDEHCTAHAPPLLTPLLLDELELLDELDPKMPLLDTPLPPSPPSPPAPPPGLLPKVSSPSAHAAKLSPQSPIARRRMLACFTGLCFEVTRMPGCTQLPTLQGIDD